MALRLDATADERERIQPHIARLEAFVRRLDPDARFYLHPGHDSEFWELDAHVRRDLADDPDLGRQLAREETDILLDYDVAIAVIPVPRRQ